MEESHEFHNDDDPDKLSSYSKVNNKKGTKVGIKHKNESSGSDNDE